MSTNQTRRNWTRSVVTTFRQSFYFPLTDLSRTCVLVLSVNLHHLLGYQFIALLADHISCIGNPLLPGNNSFYFIPNFAIQRTTASVKFSVVVVKIHQNTYFERKVCQYKWFLQPDACSSCFLGLSFEPSKSTALPWSREKHEIYFCEENSPCREVCKGGRQDQAVDRIGRWKR